MECDLAEPESLASLGGSAPGVVDGILSNLFLTCNMSRSQIMSSKHSLTQQDPSHTGPILTC